ncbi:MAG: IS110 family transposase [Alphaproteobacteria bacterium]|nr:IS110 family transposase [Alphaproteobacteria bacterium]MBX3502321.1 IS110 family transposase [Alphaproteobacteria bacterium]MCW5738790.1 IS110 family transposase [Alphaproteobacteria bacterium]MCW5744428.1 IS110 family transposase [Alphaproteobacteria bacterium]
MARNEGLVGLDVSKEWLDCHVLPSGETWRMRNDAAGHAALIERLGALGVRCAVLEASGGYEKTAVSALWAAGLRVRVVDPKRVRHFAKALARAKNDRIDAQVIARFGLATADDRDTTILPDARRAALGELLAARHDLLDHRTALRQQQRSIAADVAQIMAQPLAALEQALATLDGKIAEAIAAHTPFAALARRLGSVPGLGPVAIAALIAWLPELGKLSRRKLARLVGVAPFDDDSGPRRGVRVIQGGRTKLRNVLYMSAMVAATTACNPTLNAHYTALRAKGKAAKLAIIACLRRLLGMLNAMVARDQDWQPAALAA